MDVPGDAVPDRLHGVPEAPGLSLVYRRRRAGDAQIRHRHVDRHRHAPAGTTSHAWLGRAIPLLRGRRGEAGSGRRNTDDLCLRRRWRRDRRQTGEEVHLSAGATVRTPKSLGARSFVQLLAAVGSGRRPAADAQLDRADGIQGRQRRVDEADQSGAFGNARVDQRDRRKSESGRPTGSAGVRGADRFTGTTGPRRRSQRGPRRGPEELCDRCAAPVSPPHAGSHRKQPAASDGRDENVGGAKRHGDRGTAERPRSYGC